MIYTKSMIFDHYEQNFATVISFCRTCSNGFCQKMARVPKIEVGVHVESGKMPFSKMQKVKILTMSCFGQKCFCKIWNRRGKINCKY